MIRPQDHISDAPCYWAIADDGAPFRCSACEEKVHAKHMLGALTPDGKFRMLCMSCVDVDWFYNAKKMEGEL